MSASKDRVSTRTTVLLLALAFFAQCTFFTYVAWHRFVDGDEGFYTLASRLVLEHKHPYVDFFYTQAPLLPYVYGVWMHFFGLSWLSAKFFAAALTSTLGSLLCAEVLRHTGKWLAGVVAVVIFAASTLIFAFYPVVKTYSLAGLLLFGAYVVVSRVEASSSLWLIGSAGLLLGLSVSTRSYLVLTMPVLLWWVLRNSGLSTRKTGTLSFLTGFLLGIAPSLYFFAASPRVFLFNNVGYHALRSEGGLLGMWSQKIVALLAVFLSGVEGNGIQTSLLFVTSLVLLMFMPKHCYSPRLAFQMATVIGVISLLPTPVHPQYFCLCIPFLLLTAVCVGADYLGQLHSRQWAAAACGLAVICYVGVSVGDFRRYLVTGDNVPGLEPGLADDYRLSQVLAVSRAIDQVASQGETVACLWPGYIFQTHTVPLRGLENDFSLPIAEAVDPGKRVMYNIVSPDDLESQFSAAHPRVIVLRDHISIPTNVVYRRKVRVLEDRFRAALKVQGYSRDEGVGDISIYAFRSQAASSY